MGTTPTGTHPLLPRGPLARVLLLGLVAVCAAGLVIEVVHVWSHAPLVETLLPFLSLSFEANLPTWYASCLLFSAGALLGRTAAEASARRLATRFHWWGLAAAFFYLSLDEAVEIHEHLGGMVGTGGLFYFDWVIPAGIAVALLGLAYVPFLRRIPALTRRRFVVSGAVYVAGALLMELPLGYWTERAGANNITYALIDFVEESLELCGVSLFVLAVRDHLGNATAEPRAV